MGLLKVIFCENDPRELDLIKSALNEIEGIIYITFKTLEECIDSNCQVDYLFLDLFDNDKCLKTATLKVNQARANYPNAKIFALSHLPETLLSDELIGNLDGYLEKQMSISRSKFIFKLHLGLLDNSKVIAD